MSGNVLYVDDVEVEDQNQSVFLPRIQYKHIVVTASLHTTQSVRPNADLGMVLNLQTDA